MNKVQKFKNVKKKTMNTLFLRLLMSEEIVWERNVVQENTRANI